MAYKLKSEGEEYNLLAPWKTLDQWQKEYIETNDNCAILTGRQTGKTTAMSIKMFEQAIKSKKGEDTLCVALTERQAYNIFSKCLSYGLAEYSHLILRGKDRPTKHEIKLKNGVKIMCHPTGLQGEGLRGYTCKRIYVDEASRVSDETIVEALLPMASVVNGTIDLASTPCGKQGYFWRAFNPDDGVSKKFKSFKVSAEDCPRHNKEFLNAQKASMSALQYAQEYLAEFLDELKRYFSDELIKKCCVLKRRKQFLRGRRYYLGVDIARMGKDESSFEILDSLNSKTIDHVESITTTKTLTTQTIKTIENLDKIWNFRMTESIGIDAGAGSLGVGIYDNLMTIPSIRRKIVPINNRKRMLDRKGKSTQKLMKEDLYDNLRGMMERGEIKLLDDEDLIESLKSIQYEYIIREGYASRMYIFGNYTHIVEGIIRAAWLASRNKGLNILIDYI